MVKKKTKYDRLSKIFGVLSNPTRLKILDVLARSCCDRADGAICVCDINDCIDLPQPYISKHLKILKEQDILKFEREGNRIHYSFGKNFKKHFTELRSYMNKFKGCFEKDFCRERK